MLKIRITDKKDIKFNETKILISDSQRAVKETFQISQWGKLQSEFAQRV